MELLKGKQAALYRARQLTEFEWTPLRDVPIYDKALDKKVALPAGTAVRGMLYSSTEPTDTFVCENISFETFRTVVADPDSALYCKDLGGHNNSWAYFGIVCNGLVRYALNIRRRYSTKRFFDIPGMRKIADAGCYTAEQIEICDVLHAYGKGRNHVALITDVQKDENGTVCAIEVSEAIRPSCTRRQFSTAEYFEKYKIYSLCRYDHINDVPMPDEQDALFAAHEPPKANLALDGGNKTNYRANEDIIISVFAKGTKTLEIKKDGEMLETAAVSAPARLVRRFGRGRYTVRAAGETVEFCVTEPNISHRVENGVLHVCADSGDKESKLLYMEFREKTGRSTSPDGRPLRFYDARCASLAKVEELTQEEKESGIFARAIPCDAVNFKVYFENRYGIWTHTMIEI